jgi:hypothetical protein
MRASDIMFDQIKARARAIASADHLIGFRHCMMRWARTIIYPVEQPKSVKRPVGHMRKLKDWTCRVFVPLQVLV